MLKKIFTVILLAALLGMVYARRDLILANYQYFFQTPCDSPVEYRLGRVDTGYQKSAETVLLKTEEAADIWNNALDRDLLVYSPDAELTVNLIYTDRQSAFDRLGQLEEDIEDGQKSLENRMAEYERLVADFNTRLEKFNNEVAFWIERGGAPPPEYERLILEQEVLNSEGERLNQLALDLNLNVEKYNTQIGEFNRNVADYNEAIESEPEAGLYDGLEAKIDIYLTSSDLELVHTLAHEFGHALSLDHFEDPEAIMYPFSSEDITLAPGEIGALQARCAVSNWQLVLDNGVENLRQFYQAIQDNYF